MDKRRLDTKLESEAAEFLVLGRLLLAGISAFKAYVNYPGYDLIATDADIKTSIKIQVKSRYQTDWDGFIIKNPDESKCDFVVFVALNRGFARIKRNGDDGVKEPEFYVLPIKYVLQVHDPNNAWGKIVRNRLVGIEEFKNKWQLVAEALRNENMQGQPAPGPTLEKPSRSGL
jgi:hypothetical protein